ncbi:MAG: peptidase T [bacterium]|nr:peptidase T [bacterium]
MSKVIERFMKYIAIDTQSEEEVEQLPSTKKQFDLANLLKEELIQIGAKDVMLDEEHAYIYATIPATKEGLKTIGFISHMDTAPSMSGTNVKARIVENYDGNDIVLNEALNVVLSTAQFPELKETKGKDLIVTDGTTLLGADDKAGIAEIMTMAEYLLSHPEIPHGTIKIGFTPDEEVGRGVDFFNVEQFGADFAYTVDGGKIGELEYENFNAASGKVAIKGSNIHPGSAKNKMVNSLHIGMEFQAMLPKFADPANTEGYEGFYHLDSMSGGVEDTVMDYIIRDHDKDQFEEKKERFAKIAEYLNDKYGEGTVTATIKDSYYNMKSMIEPHMHLIENAKAAMEELEITPIVVPIRGGTDGARLSYMGLPCPNICTGGFNFHGKYEYIPVQDMEKIVELLIKIVEKYSCDSQAD